MKYLAMKEFGPQGGGVRPWCPPWIHRCLTALFTKLPAGSRNDLRDRSPIHGFTVFQELYQANGSAGGFVNSAVNIYAESFSGGSRIFRTGGHQPQKWGANLFFLKIYQKTHEN